MASMNYLDYDMSNNTNMIVHFEEYVKKQSEHSNACILHGPL
jgi:hypothetical protein